MCAVVDRAEAKRTEFSKAYHRGEVNALTRVLTEFMWMNSLEQFKKTVEIVLEEAKRNQADADKPTVHYKYEGSDMEFGDLHFIMNGDIAVVGDNGYVYIAVNGHRVDLFPLADAEKYGWTMMEA